MIRRFVNKKYNFDNLSQSDLNELIEEKQQKDIDKEIILVDDFSSDGSRQLIKESLYKKVNKVIYHNSNLGKGACIKSALKKITGEIILIQDADLEYSPSDYKKLISPIIKKKISCCLRF